MIYHNQFSDILIKIKEPLSNARTQFPILQNTREILLLTRKLYIEPRVPSGKVSKVLWSPP